MSRENILKALLLLVIFVSFILKGVLFLDPDFGWHYQMGKIIDQQGIPSGDPLSYTMPSYPFVDHESLTNQIIYKLYPYISIVGLTILTTLIVFLTVYLATYKTGSGLKESAISKHIKFYILVLALFVLLPFYGVRPQVQSWLWVSILNLVLINKPVWDRYKFLLPILIFFWVNLHGSFAVSLVLTAIFMVGWLYQRKLRIADVFAFSLMVLASFCSRYGVRAWWEVWMQITDTELRWRIMEWRPSFFSFNPAYILFLGLSSVLIFWNWRKVPLGVKVGYLFLLLASLSAVRQVPLWLIISIPVFVASLNNFYLYAKKKKFGLKRFNQVAKCILVISVITFVSQILLTLNSALTYSEKKFYPKDSIMFLQKTEITGEIYTPYEWGGYLIWKLPGKRNFIDGRMPSWRWEDNPKTESANIMEDYLALNAGDADYKYYFQKFNINYALLPIREIKLNGSSFDKKFLGGNKFLEKIFGINNSNFKLSEKLEEDGWKRIHEDDVAKLYIRPEIQ
jgi:hypothetical protein